MRHGGGEKLIWDIEFGIVYGTETFGETVVFK